MDYNYSEWSILFIWQQQNPKFDELDGSLWFNLGLFKRNLTSTFILPLTNNIKPNFGPLHHRAVFWAFHYAYITSFIRVPDISQL